MILPVTSDIALKGAPIAVLDVETTGLDPATSYVIDVAVMHVGALGLDDKPHVAFSSKVRPPVSIPPEITELTGISDADVAGAPSFADIADQVLQALDGHVPCAYNAPFDARFVDCELRRCERMLPSIEWLDPKVWAKDIAGPYNKVRLSNVAANYGWTFLAHRAQGDADVTARLLTTLLRDAREHGSLRPEDQRTVRSFAAWQREVAIAQEKDFLQWATKKGKALDGLGWHDLLGVPWRSEPTAPKEKPWSGSRCSSCQAPVIWAETASGKKVPLDLPERVVVPVAKASGADGRPQRIVFVASAGNKLVRCVDAVDEPDEHRVIGRETHFATCPRAAEHRRAS